MGGPRNFFENLRGGGFYSDLFRIFGSQIFFENLRGGGFYSDPLLENHEKPGFLGYFFDFSAPAEPHFSIFGACGAHFLPFSGASGMVISGGF